MQSTEFRCQPTEGCKLEERGAQICGQSGGCKNKEPLHLLPNRPRYLDARGTWYVGLALGLWVLLWLAMAACSG